MPSMREAIASHGWLLYAITLVVCCVGIMYFLVARSIGLLAGAAGP